MTSRLGLTNILYVAAFVYLSAKDKSRRKFLMSHLPAFDVNFEVY